MTVSSYTLLLGDNGPYIMPVELMASNVDTTAAIFDVHAPH